MTNQQNGLPPYSNMPSGIPGRDIDAQVAGMPMLSTDFFIEDWGLFPSPWDEELEAQFGTGSSSKLDEQPVVDDHPDNGRFNSLLIGQPHTGQHLPVPQPSPATVAQDLSPAGGSGSNWDYAIEVWPVDGTHIRDGTERTAIDQHVQDIERALARKNLRYEFAICNPVDQHHFARHGRCRRYLIHRIYRDNERARLEFLQVFSTNRPYNRALHGYCFKMAVVLESRRFASSESYPSGMANNEISHFNPLNPNGDPTLIPSDTPSPSASSLTPTTPPALQASSPNESSHNTSRKSSSRMKPVPKPVRQVVKNREGKYMCTWPDCTEPVKEFARRCEWSKHMDKHERPYKCQAPGCEKLPGFTYAGGLLRHGREVHNQHGGPKNPLFCPHANCKRYNGKEFARLENLNEHLRRCHTDPNNGSGSPAVTPADPGQPVMSPPPLRPMSPQIGDKRKADDDEDLREEVKRLRAENVGLKSQQMAMMQQLEEHRRHITQLQAQIQTYQSSNNAS